MIAYSFIILSFILYWIWGVYLAWRKRNLLAKSRLDPLAESFLLSPQMRGEYRDTKMTNKIELTSNFTLDPVARAGLKFRGILQYKKEADIRENESENIKLSNSFRGDLNVDNSTEKTHSETLNMDHIKLSFSQFLWGYVFIGLNASILWAVNVPIMLVRRRIGYLLGLSIDFNIASAIAELVLETYLVTGFIEICDEDFLRDAHLNLNSTNASDLNLGERIGRFQWNEVPFITNDDTMDVVDIVVYINMHTRKCVGGRLLLYDDSSKNTSSASSSTKTAANVSKSTLMLSTGKMKDIYTILCFYIFSAFHVKIHSYANWGVNPEATNEAVRHYSVSTVMYNYFGKSVFHDIMSYLYTFKLTSAPFAAFNRCCDLGIKQGVPSHRNLHNLNSQESKLSYFTTVVRKRFMKLFSESIKEFEGSRIQGEALFIGSIIHSLDHSQMAYTIKDSLWIESGSDAFRTTAEISRIIRVGFVSDIPGLLWNPRCRGSTLRIFGEIYK